MSAPQSPSPWSIRSTRTPLTVGLAAALAASLVFAAAVLTYNASDPFAGILVAAGFAGAILLVGSFLVFVRWSARRDLPHVARDAGEKRLEVLLPSGGVFAASATLGCLFLVGGLVLAGCLFWQVLHETGFAFWGMALIPIAAVAVPTLAILVVAVVHAGTRGHAIGIGFAGDGVVLRYLFVRRTIRLQDLLVVRQARSADGAPLHGIELVASDGPVPISRWPASPAQDRFLDELAQWFAEKQVPFEWCDAVLAKPKSPRAALVRLMVSALPSFLLCVFAGQALTIIGSFWWDWWQRGGWDMYRQLAANFVGFFVGACLASTPLFGWFCRLLDLSWLERRPPVGAARVLLTETIAEDRRFPTCQEGRIGADGDCLVLTSKRQEWRIARSEIVSVTRLSLLQGFLHMWDRHLVRPVRLTWREGSAAATGIAGDEGTLHALLLRSRDGWTFWHELRRDGELFRAIQNWRQGAAPLRLASAPPWGPGLLGVLSAALLVTLVCGHNYALVHRIYNGRWQPPVRAEACRMLSPAFLGRPLQAQAPGDLLLISPSLLPLAADAATSRTTRESSWTGALNVWSGYGMDAYAPKRLIRADIAQGVFRPVVSGVSVSGITLSFPGQALHLLCPGDFTFGLSLFPSDLHAKEQFPPRVISVETGQSVAVPGLRFPYLTALYEGQRLFWADWPAGKPDELDSGWIDLETGESHEWGRAKTWGKDSTYCYPLFFPGGNRVLWRGEVLDLATGGRLAVEEPAEEGWEKPWLRQSDDTAKRVANPAGNAGTAAEKPAPREWTFSAFSGNSFARGERIAVQVALSKDNETRYQVWEIDPQTGRVDVLARLPRFTRLVSVDGSRWLVAQTNGHIGTAAEIVYQIDDLATGDAVPILRERKAIHHSLERGTDNLLTFSPETGWAVQKIAELRAAFGDEKGEAGSQE